MLEEKAAEARGFYDDRIGAKLRMKEIAGKLTELKARLKELENAQGAVSPAQCAD